MASLYSRDLSAAPVELTEGQNRLGAGEGGKNEDDEYFDLLPNI